MLHCCICRHPYFVILVGNNYHYCYYYHYYVWLLLVLRRLSSSSKNKPISRSSPQYMNETNGFQLVEFGTYRHQNSIFFFMLVDIFDTILGNITLHVTIRIHTHTMMTRWMVMVLFLYFFWVLS